MKIPIPSFWRSVAEEWNAYIVTERRYTIAAVPITTSKFGPSGSLKKENIALAHTMDVMPNISNEIFFDLNNILVVIVRVTRSES
jgi:hypothetical protein